MYPKNLLKTSAALLAISAATPAIAQMERFGTNVGFSTAATGYTPTTQSINLTVQVEIDDSSIPNAVAIPTNIAKPYDASNLSVNGRNVDTSTCSYQTSHRLSCPYSYQLTSAEKNAASLTFSGVYVFSQSHQPFPNAPVTHYMSDGLNLRSTDLTLSQNTPPPSSTTPPPPGPDINFLSGRGTAWSARMAEGYVNTTNHSPAPAWILVGTESSGNAYDGEIAAGEDRYVLCVSPGTAAVPASYNAVYNQSNWRPRFYSGWSGAEFAVSANKLRVQNATKSAMHAECQLLGPSFTVTNFHQSRDRAGNRGGWNAGGIIANTGPNQHLLRDPSHWLRNSSASQTSQFLIYIKDQN